MTKEYCSLSIRVDEDGYAYIVDDRGLKVKGVTALKINMNSDEITEATIKFFPAPKKKEGDKSIGFGVGRMRLF